jgi:threonine/homoserine/homoserine lactone efflux protein
MIPNTNLLAFAFALVIAAGTPGPGVAALVARVLTGGFRSVFPFLLAMWIGEVVWLTVAVTGLATLAREMSGLFIAIKTVGVAYLLYLAWRMWTAPAKSDQPALPVEQSPWRLFFAGLMIALGNPKIVIFYVALLPALVDLSHMTLLTWGELAAVTVCVIATMDLSWSLAAVRARKMLSDTRVRVVKRLSAMVMAGAAALIATH